MSLQLLKKFTPEPVKNVVRIARRARDLRRFSNPIFRQIDAVEFNPPPAYDRIAGWLTPRERQMLYALGRHLPGPFVEIGSWVGLSTSAIALGIKDSGERKAFTTHEFGISIDNFRPIGPDRVGMFLPGTEGALGSSSMAQYERELLPVLKSAGGPIGQLKRNLASLDLSHLVEIKVGDFKNAEAGAASFVFCDAVHDVNEIRTNAPHLLKFLRPGSILACHDIGIDPILIEELSSHIPIKCRTNADSLMVCEVGQID